MDRQLFTATLQQKLVLSEPGECYHLQFSVEGISEFDFVPGQFISCIAEDERGKQQTRAYSIASAPRSNVIDLCLNRVEDGFFSNLLCDLEPAQTMQFHGPHGLFTLKQPLTDSILIAVDTGIAPIRGFIEWLFPEDGEDRSQERHISLVHGAHSSSEIYYQKYFEKIAAERHNFHYLPIVSHPHDGWEGLRGYVPEHLAKIVADRKPAAQDAAAPDGFDIHAYICGLNEMISPCREKLKELGWQRKQIVFERYD